MPGVVKTKVITPEKIVPFKSSLPSLNISVKKDFTQTFFLTNVVTHFKELSVTVTEYEQRVNKHNISYIKLLWEKVMGCL